MLPYGMLRYPSRMLRYRYPGMQTTNWRVWVAGYSVQIKA
jgi:hypothetical protein